MDNILKQQFKSKIPLLKQMGLSPLRILRLYKDIILESSWGNFKPVGLIQTEIELGIEDIQRGIESTIEDIDLEIYENQNRKCFNCGCNLITWSTRNNKAYCSDCLTKI